MLAKSGAIHEVRKTLLHSCSNFPLPFQLRIEKAMAGRFFAAAFGMVVERSQPAVSGQQARHHTEGSLESQNRALTMTKPSQCDSEIKVPQREEVLQTNRNQRLFGGVFVAALP